MLKYIFGAIALIVVLGAVYYFAMMGKPAGTLPNQPSTTGEPAAAATTSYSGDHFSAIYPKDFTVDPSFQNTEVSATKPIPGVKFQIPATMATGTNLASDSYMSVEWLEHAKKCTADIYLLDNVTPHTVTDNGVEYSVATTSGAGAGNLYEETVYALPASSPCIAVRYFVHSSNIGNYPPGSVQEFNRDALMSAFDSIRRSIQLANAPATSAPASTTPTQP